MGGETKDYVSYSRLTTYSCPVRGYYGYERRLRKKGPPSVFPIAGSAGHDALDVYYRTDSMADAMAKLEETWEAEGGKAIDLSGDSLNLLHMKKVLSTYINSTHKAAYEPIYLADMVGGADMASEAEITIVFPEVTRPIRMVLDRVMKHKRTGDLEVWDTKFTASQLSPFSKWAPPPDDKYMMSHQIPLYTTAWRELTGLDIQAGKIEAIYMGTAARATPGEVRLIDIFDRWDEEIRENALEWVQDKITEMEWRKESKCYPQIDGAMERQYICGRCQYRSLCEARPSAREGLIELHYEEREKRV